MPGCSAGVGSPVLDVGLSELKVAKLVFTHPPLFAGRGNCGSCAGRLESTSKRCVTGSQRSWNPMGTRGRTRDVRGQKAPSTRALGRSQARARDLLAPAVSDFGATSESRHGQGHPPARHPAADRRAADPSCWAFARAGRSCETWAEVRHSQEASTCRRTVKPCQPALQLAASGWLLSVRSGGRTTAVVETWPPACSRTSSRRAEVAGGHQGCPIRVARTARRSRPAEAALALSRDGARSCATAAGRRPPAGAAARPRAARCWP